MRSIQSIIFIRLFAVVIIFFGVVAGVAYVLTREATTQFVVSDATTSLSFIINNVRTNYESDLTALDEISCMEGLLPFDEPVARSVVNKFLRFPNIFGTVHLYRADGELVFAKRRANMGSYVYKQNFHEKDPDFISQAEKVIREKRPAASDVIFSPKGTLYQTYITPVFSDEKKEHVFGILSGGVFPRLQRIDHLLYGLKLGDENFILITDSHGHFITSDGITEAESASIKAHTDLASKRYFGAGANSRNEGERTSGNSPGQSPSKAPEHSSEQTKGQAPSKAPEHSPGQTQGQDPSKPPEHSSGQPPLINNSLTVGDGNYIVISMPIDELKLVMTFGVNTHRIEANSKDLSYRLLVALVIGLLLTLVSSFFIGDRLARPFREIADAISRINRGDLSARIEYSGDDEIGFLGKAVNALGEKISKSEYLGNLWSIEELSDTAPERNSEASPDKSETSPGSRSDIAPDEPS
ncbi:MAG: HAMP domain-containing protein [Cyanobacteria bacterium HKST-UBA02]|nr:HAMP domain-containing protein [Cyanobacteria bacterium HKST-UBA02]